MNADRHQLDPTIATWLADGPVAATDETRRAISATIRRTVQGRPIGSLQVARQSRLLAAAALLVAVVALVVSAGGLGLVVPFESPSPAPASPPPVLPSARVEVSASPNPTRGTATLDRPRSRKTFTYELPAELGLRPREFSFVGVVGFVSTTLAFPSFPPPADALTEAFLGERGIAVADVTGTVEHGSVESHPAFGASAAKFLTGLDASDYFVVEDRARASIGVVPGWSARVTTEGEGSTHIDTGPGGREGSVELGVPNLIFVADVGDAIVLVEVWAKTPQELADWLPRALPFVDSIRFEPE